MDRIFVPLVTVDIQPRKNSERPSIEMTTRTCQAPTYEVPLIKHKWGKHAETVTERAMIEKANPLYELIGRQGMSAIEAEEDRLLKKYGQVLYQVYPVGTLAEQIQKVAKASNKWLEDAEAHKAEMLNVATEKAAEALVKESARAVAKVEAQKRGPGRPRKVPQESDAETVA